MDSILWTSFWAMIASAFCAFLFNAGKPDIIPAAITGGIGWFVYRLVFVYFALPESVGYLLGSITIALLSEILAYLIKNPATVYLLPALFPLVPGYGLFATMQALVTGEINQAVTLGYNALIAAGAIALGIAVVTSGAHLLSAIIRKTKIKK